MPMRQVKWRRRVMRCLTSPEDWLQALVNQWLERRALRARHLCRELVVLLQHRVRRQVRRRRVRRELRVRAEAVALAPLGYRAQPDSLPAADSVQPAVVVVVAAALEFRAYFARRKLARRR